MIVVPIEAQAWIARLMVGAGPVLVRLFTNDHQPGVGDSASHFVEPVDGGYAAQSLDLDAWTVTAKEPTTIVGRRCVFDFMLPAVVHGYTLTHEASGIMLGAERFLAPFKGKGQLAITPRLDLTTRRF